LPIDRVCLGVIGQIGHDLRLAFQSSKTVIARIVIYDFSFEEAKTWMAGT
jgi:hypothetical protein